MKMTSSEILRELRTRLQFDVGRHIYAVMGNYAALKRFETRELAQMKDLQGNPLPAPLDLDQILLTELADEEISKLVKEEAKGFQISVQYALNQKLDGLLRGLYARQNFVCLKQFNLMFAYELDFGILRNHAANQNHLLLLLPGQMQANRVLMFHEARSEFQRNLPFELIADNYLWELTNA